MKFKDIIPNFCFSLIKLVCYFQLLTVDPTLAALGLPPYPTLSANTEASKVEEIRRTVYVGNIPKDCVGDEVMKFFNDSIGEVSSFYLSLILVEKNICFTKIYLT